MLPSAAARARVDGGYARVRCRDDVIAAMMLLRERAMRYVLPMRCFIDYRDGACLPPL